LSGTPIDDVVFIYYAEGNSYTGESMLEISAHGNPFIAGKILEDLFARGCRAAEPGEFTRTAFINGKLDLSQAEAVVDVIRARSDRALEVARRQLKGSVGECVNILIDNLLNIISEVEAYIDFPDEDLPEEDSGGPMVAVGKLQDQLGGLISTSYLSALIHDGARTVILGAPNAGKSSLLNALTARDRVIVAAEPGTTRDFVEEPMMLGGHRARLIDTAGLHEAGSEVEEKGMAKTHDQVEKADILLLVLDAASPALPAAEDITRRMRSCPAIVVENKIDLDQAAPQDEIFPELPHLRVSALTGEGIVDLRRKLHELLEEEVAPVDAGEVILSARHADALREAKEDIGRAVEGLQGKASAELVASDLRGALDALGRITGKVDNEAMLDKLFARFCIGK
jgi:tRNA modification GTPase